MLQINASCGSPNAAKNLAIAVKCGGLVTNVREGILDVTREGNLIAIVDLT